MPPSIQSILNELKAPLHHYRDTLKNEWNLPAELVEFLNKHGYKKLGGGHFSDVYARPGEKFVLKIINRETTYDCYLNYIEKMRSQSNPHFPKIGKTREFTTPSGRTWYIILVERLRPCTLKQWETNPQCRFADEYRVYKVLINRPNVREHLAELTDRFPQLAEALEFIHEHFNGSCRLDIKMDNLMWRDKTLVLTDPLGAIMFDD